MTDELLDVDMLIHGALADRFVLTLWNDDHSSVEHVMTSLIQIINVDLRQASQHTMEAHFNGSSFLREGEWDELEGLHEKFGEKGITTSVDKL